MLILESWVITVLILVMAYLISRAGRPGQGVATLPLAIVPLCNLLSGPLARSVIGTGGRAEFVTRVAILLVGLVVSCVLYGFLAGNMGGKAARRSYIVLCSVFSAILTVILIYHITAHYFPA